MILSVPYSTCFSVPVCHLPPSALCSQACLTCSRAADIYAFFLLQRLVCSVAHMTKTPWRHLDRFPHDLFIVHSTAFCCRNGIYKFGKISPARRGITSTCYSKAERSLSKRWVVTCSWVYQGRLHPGNGVRSRWVGSPPQVGDSTAAFHRFVHRQSAF